MLGLKSVLTEVLSFLVVSCHVSRLTPVGAPLDMGRGDFSG